VLEMAARISGLLKASRERIFSDLVVSSEFRGKKDLAICSGASSVYKLA
jgi:hypothetical protein